MAAVGKFGGILAVSAFLIIIFYLVPNKEQLQNIQMLSYIVGGLFFLGLLLAFKGGQRHARKHGWIS